MISPIPYGRQNITQEDIDAVTESLLSDFLTQGPRIEEFEKNFAKYVGAKYAVAVSNGTAALHLCALSLNVAPGQKVITSPITFAASANCIKYCGGEVVFADIDPDTYLLDINSVKKLLEASPKGTYSGVVQVDFAGAAVNLELFRKLADEYGLWIIEDACHAPGGYFIDSNNNHQLCGNGKFADLSIFSFHPVKHIATGEGGMITTNDEGLYKRLLILRTHGITKDPQLMNENHGGWYYEMVELGYNYRLTDVQAALGNSQLKRADEGLAKRKLIAKKYDQQLAVLNKFIHTPKYDPGHAFHLYVIQAEDRKSLYDFLRERKIFTQVHYIPVHTLPYYKNQGWKYGDFPIAEKYYEKCLSLPIYPSLSAEQQDYVIESINQYFQLK